MKNLLYKKPQFLPKLHVFPLITHEPKRVSPWELKCIHHQHVLEHFGKYGTISRLKTFHHSVWYMTNRFFAR